jgi:hypothetical protein
LDKFNTVVAEIERNLELPDGKHGIQVLLHAALEKLAKSAGYSVGGNNTLATMARAGEKVLNFCTSAKLDYSFTLAMQAAMRALIDGDEPYLREIANCLGRGAESFLVNPAKLNYRPGAPSTQAQAVRLRAIGLGSAEQLIRLIAFLAVAGIRSSPLHPRVTGRRSHCRIGKSNHGRDFESHRDR